MFSKVQSGCWVENGLGVKHGSESREEAVQGWRWCGLGIGGARVEGGRSRMELESEMDKTS